MPYALGLGAAKITKTGYFLFVSECYREESILMEPKKKLMTNGKGVGVSIKFWLKEVNSLWK